MDKFHVLYNEMGCNFMEGTNTSREQFKAALDAYIDERIGAARPTNGVMKAYYGGWNPAEHPPIPVEGKNATVKPHHMQPRGDLAANAHMFLNVPGSAAVSTEGNTYHRVARTHDEIVAAGAEAAQRNGPFTPAPKTVPLPVAGRCKDCKHWNERNIGDKQRSGRCSTAQYAATDSDAWCDHGSYIFTASDFGCVHFEAKGGT